MADPFVAEIRMFGFNFPPKGWAFCNGQLLPISQNTALFSLLGTNYGGDGKSTFALPNLQDSVPLHQGQGPGLSSYVVGQSGGEQAVTLLESEMPSHTHGVKGSTGSNQTSPAPGNAWASGQKLGGGNIYAPAGNNVPMSPSALSPSGGSLPHNNMQPYLVLNFCIALSGIFPPRT